MRLAPYIRIARVDHWIKNIFVLPGIVVAYQLTHVPVPRLWLKIIVGLIAVCLVTSANYVINEWLDREFDRFHPVKKARPSVVAQLSPVWIYAEYALLAVIGLGLASLLSRAFFITACALLVAGWFYNIQPLRTKDRAYFDVITESINNPLRLLLGWYLILPLGPFPPSSLLVAYWMGGAYLMSVKRYSEFRFIADRTQAGLYRRSFQTYTEEALIISSLFYALCATSLGGVFLVKHKIELLLTLPLFALLFAWYFYIGLKPNSSAQHPEYMYKEKGFLAYVAFVVIATFVCLRVQIPSMHVLLENAFVSEQSR